jgi:putative transposase
MPRALRIAVGGIVYHVLNRANAQITLFETHRDYEAFHRVLVEAHERVPMRTLAYCVMPNHWHLVLWPHHDGDLSAFVRWLTLTHTQRWHAARETAGSGHVYQGRFKSLPVQSDGHFLTVCRYVERNALRAGLVERAEAWPWGSLWRRECEGEGGMQALLSPWPVARPPDWTRKVNEPHSEAELLALRRCIARGAPYGAERWVSQVAEKLGLELTLRPRGRPRKRQA